ncbi:hypothetical protein MSBR3_1345 [Methanosarcina barkeri 3]|uniref:Uncharacterized protein n=1 Tax=Methanosarcina barkeri 3 TaxID=1434107 RepID=A0A0E3SM54_METBA|nr:hypothetical protein MSBR3_1345 [Methanosarcina barkeri 3]
MKKTNFAPNKPFHLNIILIQYCKKFFVFGCLFRDRKNIIISFSDNVSRRIYNPIFFLFPHRFIKLVSYDVPIVFVHHYVIPFIRLISIIFHSIVPSHINILKNDFYFWLRNSIFKLNIQTTHLRFGIWCRCINWSFYKSSSNHYKNKKNDKKNGYLIDFAHINT